jgi:hypothetical protein
VLKRRLAALSLAASFSWWIASRRPVVSCSRLQPAVAPPNEGSAQKPGLYIALQTNAATGGVDLFDLPLAD